MVQSNVTISEPASVIWKALTDKAQMKEWYFDIPDFELKTGSTFNFYEPGGANQFHHQCTITEIVPNEKISHTWTHPELSKGESLVTWLLEEKNGKTNVTVLHEGAENFADAGPDFSAENYQIGWNGIVAFLKNYAHGLRKRTYSIDINAPAEKVWNTMWNSDSYKQWSSVFSQGSYYTGELKPGGRVRFLTPSGNGMYSDVIFYVPNSYVMFQHVGNIKNLEEQPVDEESDRWSGAFETYSLTNNGDKTTLTLEIDTSSDEVELMDKTQPKALAKIKEIAENQ